MKYCVFLCPISLAELCIVEISICMCLCLSVHIFSGEIIKLQEGFL